jgi:hypothetical protein
MTCELAVVAAVNNDEVLEQNLLRSPGIASGGVPIVLERGHPSAGAAYNAGMKRVEARHIAFVHQDVYLPAGWDRRLHDAIAQIESDWAVLGVWGIQADGRYAGRVWCSGGNREHRAPVAAPVPVVSVDEVVIVLRAGSCLSFDEGIPGYHLYGTDIIMQAQRRGLSAYVFDGPVVHNSRVNIQVFDAAFFAAYRAMQRKWRAHLPLFTCTVPVTRWGWPLYKAWLRREWRRRRAPASGPPDRLDASHLAQQLGYEPGPLEGAAGAPAL